MWGKPADESAELPEAELPGFFDEVPSDRRPVRAVLGGVAAVAVLAGGAGAFLWLGSVPPADASAVGAPGALSTPSVSETTAPSSSVAFAASGRDVFDQFATPAAAADADSTAQAGGTGSSTGSTSSTSSTGASGGTGTSVPATGTSPATGKPSATAGATATTTKAPTATTTTPATPPKPTPTVSRSTAPAWQQGVVRFDGIPEGSTTGEGEFTLDADGVNPVAGWLTAGSLVPSTSTVYRPWGITTERGMNEAEKAACEKQIKNAATSEDAAKINRMTKNCSVTDDYVWQAVFVPSSQAKLADTNAEAFGWLVATDSKLADAVVGKVTGTIRWIGGRGDRYLVQVDDEPGVWVKAGDAVPGTPLVFEGIGLDSIARGDVAVFKAGGTQYFTVIGGGENAGITF
ncbi:hypothetical protein GTQ99_05600 [Kineococcus sp. T13]|uniref:hypothetical protein n=1 Tax=Kineococcus vitellinus TaxID=2696565 RepID=UPI001412CD1E|nr:hypothetical protein [Kineococcus vitellinus]NAZ74900.1 hypothetical protein [Kineococcus vitellinus]